MKVTEQLAKIGQEKFGFEVTVDEETLHFAPFDSKEASDKTRSSLVAAGLTVSESRVYWTVGSARKLAATLRPVADQPATSPATPEAEIREIVETPEVAETESPAEETAPETTEVAPEPEPEIIEAATPAAVARRGRGRRAS